MLQANARSSLESMINKIRMASRDHIFTETGFNIAVPLPADAYDNKPYLYFAKPNVVDGEAGGLKVQDYDYYLYYVARISYESKDIEDEKYYDYYDGRAKLKSLVYKKQSRAYTEDPRKTWPFLPPIISLGVNYLPQDQTKEEREKRAINPFFYDELGNLVPDPNKVKKESDTSYLSFAKVQDQSPEFSLYQSDFYYSFSPQAKNLFQVQVNLVDEISKTTVSFESAVTPRN